MTRRRKGGATLPYWLLSPAVVVTLFIVFVPMAKAVFLSLHDYLIWKPTSFAFVGLKNFITALGDEVFWISAWHTLIWIGLTVPAQMLLGLVTALLLNR
ncbi:MAG: sugar ABC transporter permease, partial [Bauldia litoralis]